MIRARLLVPVGVLSAVQQFRGAATSHPSSPSLFSVCLSVLPPSIPPLFVGSPPGSPLSFCISLSPSVSPFPLSSSSPGLAVYLYATAPLLLHLTLCCFVAVVLRILPHAQTGPERLRVLLQDQRAEKEVAGAVWHGHVSVRHRRGA